MTKLKQYLLEHGISQAEVVKKVGTSAGSFSSICSGKRTPSPALYQKIADALGCDIGDICEDPTRCAIGRARKSGYNRLDPTIARKKLAEQGIKNLDIARALMVSTSCVSKYLNGESGVSPIKLKKLASILHCKPEDLLQQEKPKEDAYTGLDSFNEKDESHPEKSSVEFPPAVTVCRKCALDPVEIQINSDISYPPSVIRVWIRYTLCHITDPYSPEYDPVKAGKISDCFFKFYVNKKKPLKEDARYFVREKDDKIFLKRDNERSESKHTYVISSGKRERKPFTMIMTEEEKRKFEMMMTAMEVPFTIRSFDDIF